MIEKEFVALVEQHRQEQLMSLPPADLLTIARETRRRRRRRTAAITGGILVGALLAVGAVDTARHVVRDAHDAAPPVPGFLPARRSSGPATRLVGLNGWVVRVPASWGTDQVGCEGVMPHRPSVLFDHHLASSRPCLLNVNTPSIRIGAHSLGGVPWRIVSGVAVVRHPHAGCPTCATLGVPTAGVSFEIHTRTPAGLRRIEVSLAPISRRQVTVPVWTTPATGPGALDQMTTIAIGSGLRPRAFEVPSRRPPGTFLGSNPPIGTPVDLGRSISLYFSAGDLARYATGSSLRRHGWRIFPATTAQPPNGRSAAIRSALGSAAGLQRHPAFLRTLTITHEGPHNVVVRRRRVWMVVTPSTLGSRRGASSIIAVDATTGHVIEAQREFRGRVRSAYR
jgi:hypothetical protein